MGLRAAVCLAAALLLASCRSQPPDLSGTWRLNVEKSKWGRMQPPSSVVLQVEHREPMLKYAGTVRYANEDERAFGFDGALDGKEYAATRSFGDGKIAIRRTDLSAFHSVLRSNDGKYIETAWTRFTHDGRVIRRHVRLQGPEGDRTWTEIYEKL